MQSQTHSGGPERPRGVSRRIGAQEALSPTLRKVLQEAPVEPIVDAIVETQAQAGPLDLARLQGKSVDILEIIEKLATLHESGALTDAELSAKKIELLGRLG